VPRRRGREPARRSARKIGRDELEDRIVPDGGFGADGKRTLSFGTRTFEVVLGPETVPMVREPGGKPRGDLPKPGKQDDAALAALAQDEWKTLKKTALEPKEAKLDDLGARFCERAVGRLGVSRQAATKRVDPRPAAGRWLRR
jgi:hypothetical protein